MPATETETRPKQRHGTDFAVLAERSALPAAWIALIVVYGVLTPDLFLTWDNAANILGSQAVLFVLAISALMPSMTGDFDLSLGGIMGLTAMVVGVLNTKHGVGIVPACLIGLVVAVAAGYLNGLFVVRGDTNALIVTLGMGTVFTGLIYFLSGSNTIVGIDQHLSRWTFTTKLAGIPLEFYYGLIIMLVVWYVASFTPLGLRSLFVGQSRDVARLSGIRVSRIRWGGFVLGGFVAGIAGILFLGTTGSADPTASGPYLLPAYAAVFLGATSIKPGRFNALGTGIAVYFLATGVNGLQLLGADNYVQQLFYGAALVIAVVLSRQLGRRR
ncbi:ABC transporter permease [Amycolatopsis alkalitolerans]|uniref:ABC transporter permease n=1 Tax=Amycolatopsis alkalitolerans TaxID=2547244 RepID=A0A5C4M3B2_9PSEU|nr:ABC transporter permease [Amycolatopsis alkalitolerans]TNC26866.1 ABC transporter permease [Amycolatopsis alkalitolerans]